jgi:hypothetical protein
MKRVLAGAVLGSLFFGGVALAEDKVIHEEDKTIFKKKTVVDFNDVTLEGDLTKPEGSYLVDKKKARFSSLIKLRADFMPELQKSVDNL